MDIHASPVVAIVGGGQLGSRHLQGLVPSARPLSIWVIDPSAEALATARQRLDQATGDAAPRHSVTFAAGLDALPARVDVAIIATNANIRRAVTEALVANRSVGAIVFEKVLFQAEADYQAVATLLEAKGIGGWVNCPRRMWDFYGDLRQRIGSGRLLSLDVSGSLWGLGCNSIHLLDLMAWLGGDQDYSIDRTYLDAALIPSVRPGFSEFTGTLAGRTASGAAFRLSSWAQPGIPVSISITATSLTAEIAEGAGKAWIACAADGWQRREESVRVEFQSGLTHRFVDDILAKGQCGLTPFANSVCLHLPLLRALLAHLGAEPNQAENRLCPIT